MEEVLKVYKPEQGSDLELSPCPFCGSKEVVYMEYVHTAGERWKVMCLKCTAGIDPGYARQRHIVQGMWNKRAGQEATE